MWYWGSGGVHWWEWFIGFVFTVGFWAIVIILILSLLRSFAAKDHDHGERAHDDPERTLARRFANGEIEEEEFHRRLDVLRSKGPGSQAGP
jgi:putative membrane protein